MKDLILKFIKKYPVTFISIIITAIISVLMIKLGDVYAITKNTDLLNNLLYLFFNTVFLSFLFYKIIDMYRFNIFTKFLDNILLKNILIFMLSIIVNILVSIILSLYTKDALYGNYYLVAIYLCMSYYLIIKENDIEVNEYLLKVFMNSLFLFLLYCVIVVGVGILIYIYEVLLGNVNYNVVLYIYTFISVVVILIGLLISIDYIKQNISFFSKILVRFVMMNMVFVGFIFFYIYLIKILISLKLPSNQVFAVCTLLFCLGLPVALMNRHFKGNKHYDNIINYLPILFIPALILQSISLLIRINNYGMTMMRYDGIIIIISEIIYIVFYIFKYEKLRYIYIAYSVVLFIMTIIPIINQYQFPLIFNRLFN